MRFNVINLGKTKRKEKEERAKNENSIGFSVGVEFYLISTLQTKTRQNRKIKQKKNKKNISNCNQMIQFMKWLKNFVEQMDHSQSSYVFSQLKVICGSLPQT